MKNKYTLRAIIFVSILILAIAVQYIVYVTGIQQAYWALWGLDYSEFVNYIGSHWWSIALTVIEALMFIVFGTEFAYRIIKDEEKNN